MTRSSRRVIGVASVLWGAGILMNRAIGLIRESVIGRTLGNGRETDLYQTAFELPDFLNYLLAGGVLSIVFIPIFQGHLARDDEDAGWRAFSAIANPLVLLMTLGVVAMWFATPTLTRLLFDFAPEDFPLLDRLVRIVLPAQIFHIVGGLVSATLMARDRHALPAFAPLVYSAGIVGGGVLLGPTLGAEGFAWGALIGSVLGPFGLPLIGALRHGLRWTPILDLRHPDFRRYLWLSLPVMLGVSIVAFDPLIQKYFASGMSEGTIARLTFARTLMKAPMGIFGLAAGVAAYPTLARLIARGERGEAWRTLVAALRMMLVLAVTASAALTVAGTEVATVIWGWGSDRYTPDQLAEIGRYTALFCLALWAWSGQLIIARGFYAQGNTWTPTLIGSLALIVGLPVYALLADRLGGDGLVIASSIVISAYAATLIGLLRRSLRDPADPGPGLLWAMLRLAAAAACGIAAGWALDPLLPAEWLALLRGACTGGVAALVCLAVAWLLRLPEVDRLVALFARRLRRRRR
ncbi:MAG: murein biosynthesis integral membrane protein MurJ [Myxococcales bacterium]|nr:murein biosynthesis integral membrane protein MurJ [Myxococcales bacterium]